jgi:hypothetical protein
MAQHIDSLYGSAHCMAQLNDDSAHQLIVWLNSLYGSTQWWLSTSTHCMAQHINSLAPQTHWTRLEFFQPKTGFGWELRVKGLDLVPQTHRKRLVEFFQPKTGFGWELRVKGLGLAHQTHRTRLVEFFQLKTGFGLELRMKGLDLVPQTHRKRLVEFFQLETN